MTSTQAVTRTEPGTEPLSVPPQVDVIEDTNGISVYADLPGVSKDTLNIQVDGDTLTIEGEVKLDLPENMDARYVEVSRPRYKRVFTLSKDLDTEKVSAKYEHGVLTLRIPKAEHAQPRRIDIQVT